MDDGLFFDSCKDAVENWDDDWVVCPVCAGTIEYFVDDGGESVVEVYHRELSDTKH